MTDEIPSFPHPAINEHDHFDLLVVGATPGGIACAVRAAREGLSVLLVNHSPHLGGFLTSGAGGWEAPYDGLRAPIYAEIRNAVTAYYRETYGEGSQQHLASLPNPDTRRHIDRPKVEPRIAELFFHRMVANEPSLSVLTGHVVAAVQREGRRIASVRLQSVEDETREITIKATAFVDGTYEGDLAAAADTPMRIGREARSEYGEAHAGIIYTQGRPKAPGQRGFPKDADEGRLNIRYNPHSSGEILEGPESGQADDSVMAYNFRLILTNNPANRVPIPHPEDPDRGEFSGRLFKSTVPNLPNDKIAWNGGGRLIGPQNKYPAASWKEREAIAQDYLNAALKELWLVQNDPDVPEDEREQWKDFGLAADEFPDNHHLPYEIYVREGRRLVGRYVFTEQDNQIAPGSARTPVHPDSVAITDWPLDSVACLDRTISNSSRDGIFFLSELSRPAQVPFRCLLPQDVDNLLVPVALSSSHVGWGALRLEPVWMQTGEAAGFAVALAKKQGVAPSQINPEELVRTLVENHHMVSFFNDVDVAEATPWIPAIQFLGTLGFFSDYDARPHDPLAGDAEAWSELWRKHAPHASEIGALDPAQTRADAALMIYQSLRNSL